MLGELELKNDDWVKAKETLRAASDATDGKDSYATLSLVCRFFNTHFTYYFCMLNPFNLVPSAIGRISVENTYGYSTSSQLYFHSNSVIIVVLL